jgi:isoquinoline 1-oxidoreductase alpha subunit
VTATEEKRWFTAMTVMKYTINGKPYTIDADPKMPLLWAIRDIVGLTGTKYGCGIAVCRACTVWIDGSPEKSCEKTASEGVGVNITTVEGLADTVAGAKLQQAFIDCQVPQCGYCQSGMLMVATKLVSGRSKPTDAQIDSAIANICACGTYPRVKAAIKKATGQ